MNLFQRVTGHLSTITRHKIKVTQLCFKMGLYKQGLLHDLSKYSWVELSAGFKYYQGDRSPIDAEKKALGYSLGWLHHKGRNKHHWEYWLDRTKGVLECVEMPKNYLKESICDRVAACMIYQKDKYTDESAYNYFMNGTDKDYMHPNSAALMKTYLTWIKEKGLDEAFEMIKEDV